MNEGINRTPAEPPIRHQLCGSSMAHKNCKYSVEITDALILACGAANAEHEKCIYADKGGLIAWRYKLCE